MKKQFWAILMALVMVLSMAGAAFAETVEDTTPELSGAGTEEDPYLIENMADLIAFRDSVNAGNNYADKYVKLADNIDMSSEDNWTPIGDTNYTSGYVPADTSKVFSGVFDGNNMTLFNLKITKDLEGDDPDADANIGLFSITGEGAVIKNLTITGVNISTDGRNVGALAGFAYNATLENITINGDIKISGGNNVAGVCGMTRYHDMSATDITVSGADGSVINGNNIVGGIITEIAPNGSEQTFSDLSVENIEIKGVGGVGGIVGLLTNGSMSDVSVKNVALTGKTEWNGDSMGRIRMGSVVGLLGSSGPSTVSDVIVENVTGENLDGDTVTLPVVGANYSGSIGNATEARIGDEYYATLTIALSKAESDDTITLLADVALTESIEISGDLTIDLNGCTITGTDDATGSFGLINIQPGADLTINDNSADGTGKITLTAINNREWNAYSSVISNQRGKLTVNGGTIEHLGGTDMAYGIDNLTNGTGTYAETIVNDGTIKSEYRAIRQFLNGTDAQNILTVNGGTIEGGNKSIWMQDPSTNANSGTLTVSKDATLVGDVYLFVTEGSTEWPVSISIADVAFDGESTVQCANIPEGIEVKEIGGYWGISKTDAVYAAAIKGVGYTTLQAAVDAAKDGDTVTLLADITEDVIITQKEGVSIVIDGQDKTFTGLMTVFGNGRQNGAENLAIQGINFVAKNGADSCIVSPDRTVNNKYSYSHNVTVQDCTFTDSDGTVGCAAIRHNDGGDKNWVISGCTVDDTMHSLLQVNNTNKLTVDNCKVYSKNGVNLNSTEDVEIKNSTIEVQGYAVRAGVKSGGDENDADNIVLQNSTLSTKGEDGDAVIILRASAKNATVTVKDCIVTDETNKTYHIDATAVDNVEADMVKGAGSTIVKYNGDRTWTISKKSSGGGSSSTSYQIVIEDIDDGDVVASSKSAKRNATVTLTVTADEGYELDELTVTDSKGKEISVTKKSNGKYTFTMPSSKVTVDATFVAEDQDDTVNTDFVDVDDKAYYADAVKWAVENDVTTGTGKNTFGPGEITTRAQTVTFLWRAMGSPEPKTTVCPFKDVTKSAYYYDAVLWAVEKGITEGTSATEFSPNETVTRAQTVTFLWRMAGKPEVTAAGAFADVAADAYYHQAVEWAVKEEITSGTSATTFSPAAACARAQIVTFLYNYLGK